ncbi:MAG: hypothetical protein GF334_07145, partial [Candidatus Altiarchaeales archaeon]|nr:hypothetical protein [Candidatus Altiarchaeales archaeon]
MKVLMVVAKEGFRDPEYFTPRRVFDDTGFEVVVASDSLGQARGLEGGSVEVDVKIADVEVQLFDAVIFIGGGGAKKFFDYEPALDLAKTTQFSGKLLAAICIAPVLLAKAGVLGGKKATVWSSPPDQTPVEQLRGHGAEYVDEPVVEDG